jgi:hypothetical protein
MATKSKAEIQAELDEAKARLAELEADPRLPRRYTEAGIAERNAKLEAEGRLSEGPHVSVGDGPFEKSMRQKGDEFAEGRQEWEVTSPFRDTMKQHLPPGHVGRHLSPRHIDSRGMRGWELVTDKDGKQVRTANMLLGSMPVEKAEQRKRFYAEKTAKRTRQVEEKFQESQEQARAAGLYTPGNSIQIERRVVD